MSTEIASSNKFKERQLHEGEMSQKFYLKSQEILSNPDRFHKESGSIKVGLEIEYSVLGGFNDSVPEHIRNTIIQENQAYTDVELGAAQLEMRTDPVDITKEDGFKNIFEMANTRDRTIRGSAKKQGVRILSSGSNPFANTKSIVRTDKEKYRQVPSFHNDNKRRGLHTIIGKEPVDVGDAAIISLMNSVQANIEAKGFEDAIDKLNRSLMISPLVVAISANARFVDLCDTGIADIRMIAWEISHDTRTLQDTENGVVTRVGLPANYYLDLEDYFQRVSAYPFILYNPDCAFEIGIGLNWRDTRIKVIDDSLVVEFRPVSTQPTVEENIACMAFYIGRLLWSQQHNEPLLNMNLVHENKERAMLHGFDTDLWVLDENGQAKEIGAKEAINDAVRKALEGLEKSNVSNMEWVGKLFTILTQRLMQGNPSDRIASYVSSSKNSRKDLLTEVLEKLGALS